MSTSEESSFSFSVLGSGSKGNSVVVRAGSTTVLVDAGLSCKQLCLRLAKLEIDPDSIDAVLLTHEHSDHCGALDVFCKTRDVPLYVNERTRHSLERRFSRPKTWRLFETGSAFPLADLQIEPFTITHDAADPVGFVLRHGRTSIGVATDVGVVTNLCREQLRDCDALVLEANYDPALLEADLIRPWSIKQRIMGRHGHLSNEDAARLICDVAGDRLRTVVLGHLSSDCNTPELARDSVLRLWEKEGLSAGPLGRSIEVVVSLQCEPTPLVTARAPAFSAPAEEAPLEAAESAEEEPSPRVREVDVHEQIELFG